MCVCVFMGVEIFQLWNWDGRNKVNVINDGS